MQQVCLRQEYEDNGSEESRGSVSNKAEKADIWCSYRIYINIHLASTNSVYCKKGGGQWHFWLDQILWVTLIIQETDIIVTLHLRTGEATLWDNETVSVLKV